MNIQAIKDKILKDSIESLICFFNYLYKSIKFETTEGLVNLSQLTITSGSLSIPVQEQGNDTIEAKKIVYTPPVLVFPPDSIMISVPDSLEFPVPDSLSKFQEKQMKVDIKAVNDHLLEFLEKIFERSDNRNIADFGLSTRFNALKEQEPDIRKQYFNEKLHSGFKDVSYREIYLLALMVWLFREIAGYKSIHPLKIIRISYETQLDQKYIPPRTNYSRIKTAAVTLHRKKYTFDVSQSTYGAIINQIHFEIAGEQHFRDDLPFIISNHLIFDDFFNLKYTNTLHLIIQLFLTYIFELDIERIKSCRYPECDNLFFEWRINSKKFCSDNCKKLYNANVTQSEAEQKKTSCRLRQRQFVQYKFRKLPVKEKLASPAYLYKSDCSDCSIYEPYLKGGECKKIIEINPVIFKKNK